LIKFNDVDFQLPDRYMRPSANYDNSVV